MAKKLNLDAYISDTSKTQSIHNKYTRYFENEEFNPETLPKKNPENTSPAARDNLSLTVESKRINMAFSNENYELILSETERLGITCVYMINTLAQIIEEKDIDDYINSQLIRKSKNNVMRRKGCPAKRINLRFSPEVYEKINEGARRYDQTITQYVNTIIEVYTQDKHN